MENTLKEYYTETEYFAILKEQNEKYEYINGRILKHGVPIHSRKELTSPSSKSLIHSQIGMNIGVSLAIALKDRNCRVYNSDLKLKAAHSYFFPDCMVICGEPIMDETAKNAITNPTLIVEVLSESTESYDRGQKFMHYRQLASLQGYLLIAQDRVHIDAFHRSTENQWVLTDAIQMDQVITIPALGIQLSAADIYDKITFAH